MPAGAMYAFSRVAGVTDCIIWVRAPRRRTKLERGYAPNLTVAVTIP